MSKLIVANWKSNKNIEEAKDWIEEFGQNIAELNISTEQNLEEKANIIVAPPYPLLSTIRKLLEEQGLKTELAVQDLSAYPSGSYTGAVSALNLSYLNVKYAILGHSERRRYFNETSMEVAKKVEQAIEAQITPILCVDKEYIHKQANSLNKEYLSKCIISYEPVGSIGTGDNENVGIVKEQVLEIKKVFGEVKVIYGGSVNETNVGEYLLICDGVLVGSASLEVSSFIGLLKNVV